ncbi:MAG: sialidase family protein [Thermomicrobiales bacterium]
MSVPQPSASLDVRSLAGAREVVAYADGGQFPVLITAPGDTLVATLRGGAGHIGLGGRIEVIRSLDAGRTWSPSIVVADSDRDDRNPALGRAPSGALVLAYHRQGCYDETGLYRPDAFGNDRPIDIMTTRSVDAGLTWAQPVPLGDESLRTGSPFGKIVALADGTLLMAVYKSTYRAADVGQPPAVRSMNSYLIRSRDDGETWEDPSLIAEGFNETSLVVLPDGNVLAMLRGDAPGQAIWSTRSADGGDTWSSPVQVTGSMQHPADVVLLGDGSVLLTYGNRTPPFRVEGRVSRDGGQSWEDRLLIFSAPLYGRDLITRRRTDLGYPSSAIVPTDEGRRGATLYYYNPAIPRSNDLMKPGPDGPFYQADNYRAVAVTWDEAELLDAL